MRLDTARWTGLFYLGLAVTGAVDFMALRPRIVDPHDPSTTLARLTDAPAAARWLLVAELGVVITQALAAMWFFRLFRPVDRFAAGLVAAFGMVNAVMVLASAGLLATAATVTARPYGATAETVQTLYLASGGLWSVAGVPFGLWLVPMGWLVLRSRWMPRPLGWVLIVGGVLYVLGAFVGALAPDSPALANAFGYPASIGELWMVGHLLVRGGARHVSAPAAA